MGTRHNRVLDNYIGLDRLGRSLRNSGKPVADRGHRNLVKGTLPIRAPDGAPRAAGSTDRAKRSGPEFT